MALELLVTIDRPFPGLRPFESDQSLLFFGRERHTAELLRRLSTERLLAVVGSSGSGKSSLVRAGLLPALHRGRLTGATTHWRIATMKPGDDPLQNLCDALVEPDALGPGDRLDALCASSFGFVDVVQDAALARGESLLVVVDQFEELFRFAGTSEANSNAAAFFVRLLLNGTDRYDVPAYVVLTMRSDFLGECARFPGLAEALSRSQYLIPRLTREERQEAIQRPLELAVQRPLEQAITPALVQQLLNDASDDTMALGQASAFTDVRPDVLPVLQHALRRTFEEWRRQGGHGPLELDHYRTIGGIEKALDQHAESVYEQLSAEEQLLAKKIFKCVTTTENGRQLRRPTRRSALYAIVSAETPDQQRAVDAVLERFLGDDASLLVAGKQDI